jgi:hypothetical protein
MPKLYFYKLMGTEVGPLTVIQLRQHASEGKLTIEDFIRLSDSDKWVSADKVSELFIKSPFDMTSRPIRNETQISLTAGYNVTSSTNRDNTAGSAAKSLPKNSSITKSVILVISVFVFAALCLFMFSYFGTNADKKTAADLSGLVTDRPEANNGNDTKNGKDAQLERQHQLSSKASMSMKRIHMDMKIAEEKVAIIVNADVIFRRELVERQQEYINRVNALKLDEVNKERLRSIGRSEARTIVDNYETKIEKMKEQILKICHRELDATQNDYELREAIYDEVSKLTKQVIIPINEIKKFYSEQYSVLNMEKPTEPPLSLKSTDDVNATKEKDRNKLLEEMERKNTQRLNDEKERLAQVKAANEALRVEEDKANTLLESAKRWKSEGNREITLDRINEIIRRFPNSKASIEAKQLLEELSKKKP